MAEDERDLDDLDTPVTEVTTERDVPTAPELSDNPPASPPPLTTEFHEQEGRRWLVIAGYLLAAFVVALIIVLIARAIYRHYHHHKPVKPPVVQPPPTTQPPVKKPVKKPSTNTRHISNTGPGVNTTVLFFGISATAAALHYVVSLRRSVKQA